MQDTTARVLSCEPLAQELVRLILSAPEIAAQAKAGQFIHMLVPDSGHVLRRPISLMAVDAAAGTLTLAIQPKGAGTQMLCACKPGETIRVLGPLGTGFDGRGAACVYFGRRRRGRRADLLRDGCVCDGGEPRILRLPARRRMPTA